MRKSLLVLTLGFLFTVGSAYACDGGKTCKAHAKTAKATEQCMKDGKCTMGDKCPMGAKCDMKSGSCDAKAMKATNASKATASNKHACCSAKHAQKS